MAVPANPKLTEVITEFQAPANTHLSQFVRGGAYVPDAPPNAGVPSALPIRLSQLAGAVRWLPHSAVNTPDTSEKYGFRGSTLSDNVTCNPINGTGPFTYSWSVSPAGVLTIDSPTAKTTNIHRFVANAQLPTLVLDCVVSCVSTDVHDGGQFTSETSVSWTWEGA